MPLISVSGKGDFNTCRIANVGQSMRLEVLLVSQVSGQSVKIPDSPNRPTQAPPSSSKESFNAFGGAAKD
jgi:hypothetical protein